LTSRRPDYILIFLIAALLFGGLLILSSASVAVSYQRYGSTSKLILNQIRSGIAVGMAAFVVALMIPYAWLRKFALLIMLVTVAALAAVFAPHIGFGAGGARRWILFKFIFFQPSELAKLAIIIYLAAFFAKYKNNISHFWQTVLPFVLVSGTVLGLIAMEPDIGTVGIICGIAGIMFFVAGGEMRHIGVLVGVMLILLFSAIITAPYRFDRFMVYLNPGHDSGGSGYQVQQAAIAIGSGGLYGLGLGESRQKYSFLPESVGDSIFAIAAEELGFVGAGILVALFVAFALRSFRIACRAPDAFGQYLATGIASWIVLQAFINISAIVGIIPLTGVTLPFVSYGGSSLALVLAGCGILVNISKNAQT
jgi:cell division protein FtsW